MGREREPATDAATRRTAPAHPTAHHCGSGGRDERAHRLGLLAPVPERCGHAVGRELGVDRQVEVDQLAVDELVVIEVVTGTVQQGAVLR